jgi:hypothetical protein
VVEAETFADEGTTSIPTGAIIATAVGAGLVVFLLRRRAKPEPRIETPSEVAAAAWARFQDPEFRARTAAATRDFLAVRVGREMKPILLDLLKDLKSYVDDGFRRVERTIKDL